MAHRPTPAVYVRNGLQPITSAFHRQRDAEPLAIAVQYTPPQAANLDEILTILRRIQTRVGQIWTTGGGRQILLSFTAQRPGMSRAGHRIGSMPWFGEARRIRQG
jgi:hypothetical protein